MGGGAAGGGVGAGVSPDGVISPPDPSPSVSRNEANFGLLRSFLITYSLNPFRRAGWLSTTSRSCSFGSCSSAPKLAGAVNLAQRLKPSHKEPFVQIFLTMSRENKVVVTKLIRFLYVVTAWMTCTANGKI